jgi:hypothetical protein
MPEVVEPSVPEPVAPEPVVATPEPPAAPSPEPAPVAAAPAAPVPAGSPSVGEQPPVFDLSDPDLKRALERVGNNPKALVGKFFEYDSRLAETVPKLREYEERLKAVEREKAEASRVAPPVAPEPPDVDAVVSTHLKRFMDADPVCVRWQSEFQANDAKVAQFDKAIKKADDEIAYIERQLADPRLPLDDYTRSEKTNEFNRLRLERQFNETEKYRLETKNEKLEANYNNRVHNEKTKVAGDVTSRYEETQREAERKEKIERDSWTFQEVEWPTTLATVFRVNTVPEALRADFAEAAKVAALAHPGAIPPEKLYGFVEDVVKREMKKADTFHRNMMAEYGRKKAADAAPAAPVGRTAVAPASPTNDGDWEETLNARRMAMLQSRHA